MTTTVVAPPSLLTYEQHAVVFRNAPPPAPPTVIGQFEAQVARFLAFGLGTSAEYDRLREFLPDTLDFLVRPPQPKPLDFGARMAQMVELGGKRGQSWISADNTTDDIPTPTAAHLMVGVDDGEKRRNRLPSQSQVDIAAEQRSPWNVWDGIIYVSLFPHALIGRGLDLVASRCKSVYWPFLYLLDDGPTLYGRNVNDYEEWGAPSCRERRGLRA